MDTNERTIWFHTGTYKTGSTALQYYLNLNQEALGKYGVSYSCSPTIEPSVGNGQELFQDLFGAKLSDDRLLEYLRFFLADREYGICSSEDFTRFGENEWDQIKYACSALGIKVKIITFVRNVAPYYWSLYGQVIKGGHVYESFDDFCKVNQFDLVMHSLKCMLKVFGRSNMLPLHYESVQKDIDIAFLSLLNIPIEFFDRTILKSAINRNLTDYEQEIISRLIKTTGRQYAYEMSKLLMEKRPNLRSTSGLNSRNVETIAKRHDEDVAFVNANFFEQKDVHKIHVSESEAAANCLTPEIQRDIDRDVCNWLMEFLRSAQESSITYVAGQLLSIDWRNAGNSLVTPDFDPIAYLLQNPDILRAGVSPYEHFISSGRLETLRPLKWQN